MLYSTKIKLDKERTLKLGGREIIKLLDEGIDVFNFEPNAKNIFQILTVALQREDKDLTLDKVVDLFDESEIPYNDLYDVIGTGISLGMGKQEQKQEAEDTEKK